MTDRERLLDELRPVAFAIAYQMLGSVSEAEDELGVDQCLVVRLRRGPDSPDPGRQRTPYRPPLQARRLGGRWPGTKVVPVGNGPT